MGYYNPTEAATLLLGSWHLAWPGLGGGEKEEAVVWSQLQLPLWGLGEGEEMAAQLVARITHC